MILHLSDGVMYLAYYDDMMRVRVQFFPNLLTHVWARSAYDLQFLTMEEYLKRTEELPYLLEILHIDEDLRDELPNIDSVQLWFSEQDKLT